ADAATGTTNDSLHQMVLQHLSLSVDARRSFHLLESGNAVRWFTSALAVAAAAHVGGATQLCRQPRAVAFDDLPDPHPCQSSSGRSAAGDGTSTPVVAACRFVSRKYGQSRKRLGRVAVRLDRSA